MKLFFGLAVPFLDHVGVRSGQWGAGTTSVRLDGGPQLTNHFGDVHGGVLATMLDVAMASAARSQYPGAAGVVTVDMSLQFIGSAKGEHAGGLTAEGRVVRAGRTLAFCEADVKSADGRLIAKAVGTFSVRQKENP